MMDAFTAIGGRADRARAAYQLLSTAAQQHEPCPSNEALGRALGITASPARRLLQAMQEHGLIRVITTDTGARFMEIVATGERTEQTRTCGGAAFEYARAITASAASGKPMRTMTPDQFGAAIAALGRFEDSAAARRDIGSRERLPPRAMVFSGCGISDVYGSTGTRTGAGCQL